MLKIHFGRFLIFGVTFVSAVLIVTLVQGFLSLGDLPQIEPPRFVPKEIPSVKGSGGSVAGGPGEGRSCWGCADRFVETGSTDTSVGKDSKNNEGVKILSKPGATYTHAARENMVEGSVRVKVTLLASGEVGSITPISRLPFGLTDQAITAARQLKFKPKTVNGRPVTTMVTIDYSFSIY